MVGGYTVGKTSLTLISVELRKHTVFPIHHEELFGVDLGHSVQIVWNSLPASIHDDPSTNLSAEKAAFVCQGASLVARSICLFACVVFLCYQSVLHVSLTLSLHLQN